MAELRGSHGDQPNHILTRWFGTPDLHKLEVYSSKAGGYTALRKALVDMAPADITNEVKTSGLRGRGGAGFATGVKWGFINRDAPGPKYVVINAETLCTVPWIVNNGGAAYAKLGTEKSPGTRLMSVSGNVRNPGVYEVELGQTFRHVIMELAGGPPDGRRVKVFWPGGSSAPVLPESMLDTHTDMEALAAARSMGGSGGVIVMDDSHCVVRAAHRLLKFYAHESCGKCTPCRIGQDWAVRTYERILAGEGSQVELDILQRVSDGLQNGRCLCGLGDPRGWVVAPTLRR